MDTTSDAPGPARILVVEDYGSLRTMLIDELVDAGFAVDGADSVRQARSLHPETYAVLIVDDGLGDGSGIDLFRELCALDRTVESRFILMTGDDRLLGKLAGVPVLLKPFLVTGLADVVRDVLERSAGLRDPNQPVT